METILLEEKKQNKQTKEDLFKMQNKIKCPVNVLHIPNSEAMETQA